MTDFEKECNERVLSIANDINDIAESGDNEAMAEYLDDVFDIEYRINYEKCFRSVCVAVAIGGPNIYIDTDDSYVKLYWGATRMKAPIMYKASEMIDDYYMELWDCIK